MYQDGRVVNKETGAEWVVRPRLFNGIVPLPVWLPFIILDSEVDETPEKSFMVVGTLKCFQVENLFIVSLLP